MVIIIGAEIRYSPINKYGSYSSIIGNSGVSGENAIGTPTYPDMYKYMESTTNTELKTAYYTALGRERWGAYHASCDVMNNDIPDDDKYKNLVNEWFLQDYQ